VDILLVVGAVEMISDDDVIATSWQSRL